MSTRALFLAALIALPAPALAQNARAVHDRAVVLDTHFDTPALFGRAGWDFMDRHSPELDGSQVDYPRMVAGGVDGGVFTIFTAQGPRTVEAHHAARDFAIYRGAEIREMAARYPKQLGLALTADQALALTGQKRRFMIMSMENGYPFATDLSLMKTFYDLGVRMMSPVHTTNNDLADSSTDAKGPEWQGLSPAGRRFVAEANRMGIIVDGSHASDLALDQMIALSKTPVILSHTGSKAVFNHPRNIDDDRLKALAAKGGVIQINAFSGYMIASPPNAERTAAMTAMMAKYRGRAQTQAQAIAMTAERRAIEARYPAPRASIDDFMNHLIHCIKAAGIDHVGISGDFDGGGGLDGLNDVTAFPDITRRLLAAGYSPAHIDKFWGGNMLRVMRAAEAAKVS